MLRIIDIGVAATYAVLCLSVISVMGPYADEQQSAQARQDSTASSAIFGYVRSVGLPFLSTAPPSEICSSLGSASNSTTVLGGEIGGHPCPGAPETFLGVSSLNITISGRSLEIEAWQVEGR
jgi:hypothetical protein